MSEHVTPVVDGKVKRDRLVDRMGILRLAGRLAARAVGQADLVPLAVDRLSGERDTAVIAAMRQLSEYERGAINMMSRASKTMRVDKPNIAGALGVVVPPIPQTSDPELEKWQSLADQGGEGARQGEGR